jgi:hypothetical protein
MQRIICNLKIGKVNIETQMEISFEHTDSFDFELCVRLMTSLISNDDVKLFFTDDASLATRCPALLI